MKIQFSQKFQMKMNIYLDFLAIKYIKTPFKNVLVVSLWKTVRGLRPKIWFWVTLVAFPSIEGGVF